MKEFFLGLLALGAAPLFAADLLLAPGKTITILDAADPSVRVVLNAPADRPLNLSAILANDAGASVYSIVTRMQLDSAGALARRADGSIGLSASPGAALPAGEMLQGGVLVFTAGKYLYRPAPAVAASAPSAVPPTQASGGRLLISKPGATKAEAEHDIAQCRRYADAAAAQFLRSSDKVATYNGAMHACLRGFGYEIHAPAA